MLRRILSVALVICLVAISILSATAEEFKESVEVKPAVKLEQETTEDGKIYVGTIYDENDTEVVKIPHGEIIITPYSKARDEETHPEIRERLITAYKQLEETEDFRHLCEHLEEEMKHVAEDLHIDHVSVSDLIDVHLTADFDYFLEEGKNYLEITFELGVDSDLIVGVLHNYEADKWETLTRDRITRDGNKITCIFYSLSPVVFLIDDSPLYVDPDAPDSPQTGETRILQTSALAGVAALVAVAIVSFKKRSEENA